MKMSKNNKPSIKAVAFVRVKARKSADNHNCVQNQKAQINETAEELGVEIVKWFEQLGGTTEKLKNYTLLSLVEYAKQKKIKYALISSYSRISRSSHELNWWVGYLKEHGIKVVSPDTKELIELSPDDILQDSLAKLLRDYVYCTRSEMIKRAIRNKKLQASK